MKVACHAVPSCWKNSFKAAVGWLVGLCLLACEPGGKPAALQYSNAPKGGSEPVYRLAIHPLHNPKKLSAAYQPLVDYLNAQLPEARIELEASRDYQAYEAKFRAREPAFLLPNPWQTLQAIKVGYQVIAMAGDADDFKGIFIVRKDSGILQPADLKGKTVSYPSPTALAAAIMPQYYLHSRGINIRQDIHNVYVGSQESSIMNVYLGQAAAGATWPPPWRLFQRDYPVEAAQLKVVWQTPSLINNSVMVRDDVPVAVRDGVTRALLELSQVPAGKTVLGAMETARFHAANNASYDVVVNYIRRFEREVRPVENP
jgi:phosphonate transport system substrate-binding protein